MFARHLALLAGNLLFLTAIAVGSPTTATAICNDNRTPAGTLANGVLTIHLEARPAVWYPNENGKSSLLVSAFAEEGRAPQIPGPILRVPAGTEISATIRNSLDHTIYIHSLAPRPETSMPPSPLLEDFTTTSDSASMLEMPPGAVRELHFRSGAAGSYYYWASNDRAARWQSPDSTLRFGAQFNRTFGRSLRPVECLLSCSR